MMLWLLMGIGWACLIACSHVIKLSTTAVMPLVLLSAGGTALTIGSFLLYWEKIRARDLERQASTYLVEQLQQMIESSSVIQIPPESTWEQLCKELSAQLLQLFERERLIADYASDVILSFDESAQIKAISPSATNTWGCQPIELYRQSIYSLFLCSNNELEAIRSKLKSLDSNDHSCQFEVAIRAGHDSVLDTSWHVEFSTAQKIYFAVIQDISERKAVDRLRQQLYLMVGHDLKVPVMAVQVALKNLTESVSANSDTSREIQQAQRSLDRVITLSNDMLDLQKCDTGKLQLKSQIVYLPQLIEETIAELKSLLAQKAQSIQFHAPKDSSTGLAQGDEERIKQVLTNLIANASSYSPQSTMIRIDVSPSGQNVKVTVEDSGPGLSDPEKALLFEPYRRIGRTSKDTGGSGLGLALCKQLIIAQSGNVGVNDSDLGGCAFWFTLPAASENALD